MKVMQSVMSRVIWGRVMVKKMEGNVPLYWGLVENEEGDG